jgi:hypothetical protein
MEPVYQVKLAQNKCVFSPEEPPTESLMMNLLHQAKTRRL